MRQLIYLYSLNLERKFKEKMSSNRWEKMCKAIAESKLTVTIK